MNTDFARQAIFISQHVECSERYAAELLHAVMQSNPNITPLDSIEEAILDFHARRRHLADCLRFLFHAALLAQTPDPLPLHAQLDAYARQQLDPRLANKILLQVHALDRVLSKTYSEKQNAVSNTQIANGE